jgi:hypothetical protein
MLDICMSNVGPCKNIFILAPLALLIMSTPINIMWHQDLGWLQTKVAYFGWIHHFLKVHTIVLK